MSEKKVFLGGTCNKTVTNQTYRDKLIPMLKIDYFNPLVEDWTEECYQEELRQREECGYCLYVITPQMTGVYSIAEVIDDSNKRPEKTVFCYIEDFHGDRFVGHDLKALNKVGQMVEDNGGVFFTKLEDVAFFLNKNS